MFAKPLKLKQKLCHILIASFHIHCVGIQRENYKNCINAKILKDQTVCVTPSKEEIPAMCNNRKKQTNIWLVNLYNLKPLGNALPQLHG